LTARDEAFRMLRANVMVSTQDMTHRTVLVTSALPGEGKTSTCATLAHSIAAAGPVVVAVDLDLRHPDLHDRFGMPNELGVSDILAERETLADCLRRVPLAGDPPRPLLHGKSDRGYAGRGELYVLTTGRPVGHPAELLGSALTGQMLEALAETADLVLIDSPPVLPVADTLIVGRLVAGALLVVETGRSPLPAVEKAKSALIRNQTRLLGVVLNRFDSRDTVYGYDGGEAAPARRSGLFRRRRRGPDGVDAPSDPSSSSR